jgi:prevent-host-death family protein
MTKKNRRPAKKFSLLMMQHREIGAAEFKAHCLEIMDEVERLGTEVVITKHRKPVARLIPFGSKSDAFVGSLKGMVLEEKDLVSPIDVEWEADDPHFA